MLHRVPTHAPAGRASVEVNPRVLFVAWCCRYDEIYDDMQTTRLQIGAEASKAKKKQQSKYLAQMQRTVEKKKLLDALRDERIVSVVLTFGVA